MSKYIVIANWKMNPETAPLATKLFTGIQNKATTLKKTEVVIAPPFIFLPKGFRKTKKIALGTQDASWGEVGPATGEVSALQLRRLGVSHCIIGHSERRALGESDAMIAKKVGAVLFEGMVPILCVGEQSRDDHGEYLQIVSKQIADSLSGITKRDISNVVIAYEPLWAIGKNATGVIDAHGLHEMTLFIQKTLTNLYGRDIAGTVRIVYGGSVDGKNAGELIVSGNVTGFLVGRASLTVADFGAILSAVDSA